MSRLRQALLLASLSMLTLMSPECIGQATEASGVIQLSGLDGTALSIDAQEWAALPRVSVTAIDHDGSQVKFEGVPAAELLRRAGAPLDAALRGQALTIYVVAQGADGYRAVYALPEFDPAFTDRTILIADRRDGQPLGPKEGKLRMVVPGEKRQARWVRELTTLKLLRAP